MGKIYPPGLFFVRATVTFYFLARHVSALGKSEENRLIITSAYFSEKNHFENIFPIFFEKMTNFLRIFPVWTLVSLEIFSESRDFCSESGEKIWEFFCHFLKKLQNFLKNDNFLLKSTDDQSLPVLSSYLGVLAVHA